jgi:hypothetical protein
LHPDVHLGTLSSVTTNEFLQSFQWLFWEGLGIVQIPQFSFLAGLLSLATIVAFAQQKPYAAGRWKPHYWFALMQLLFYPAVISVGVLFAAGAESPIAPLPKANPVAEHALDVLFYGSVLCGALWIYLLKGLRWFAFCSIALNEIMILGGLFVAGMSLSGDWI